MTENAEKYWFAARLSVGNAAFDKKLSADLVESYRTRFAPNIVFIKCTPTYASDLSFSLLGRIFFYRDAQRKAPAPISDREMNNFIMVTSASDDIINLGTVTPDFLLGQRVRVKRGVFEGAEGVIKRIKGDRRLIVSIDGITAVATCFIRPEFLEEIEEIN